MPLTYWHVRGLAASPSSGFPLHSRLLLEGRDPRAARSSTPHRVGARATAAAVAVEAGPTWLGPALYWAGHPRRDDDRVLHVPRALHDVLRRVPRLDDRAARSRRTRSPSRPTTTITHEHAHDETARRAPDAARVAAADDDPAPRARAAVSSPVLHGGARSCYLTSQPPRPLEHWLEPVFRTEPGTSMTVRAGCARAAGCSRWLPGVAGVLHRHRRWRYWVYVKKNGEPARDASPRGARALPARLDKWRVDELYDDTVVGGVDALADTVSVGRQVDRRRHPRSAHRRSWSRRSARSCARSRPASCTSTPRHGPRPRGVGWFFVCSRTRTRTVRRADGPASRGRGVAGPRLPVPLGRAPGTAGARTSPTGDRRQGEGRARRDQDVVLRVRNAFGRGDRTFRSPDRRAARPAGPTILLGPEPRCPRGRPGRTLRDRSSREACNERARLVAVLVGARCRRRAVVRRASGRARRRDDRRAAIRPPWRRRTAMARRPSPLRGRPVAAVGLALIAAYGPSAVPVAGAARSDGHRRVAVAAQRAHRAAARRRRRGALLAAAVAPLLRGPHAGRARRGFARVALAAHACR